MDQSNSTIQLSELLGALSTALDITEGQPVGHSMRTCWIGMHVGRELKLASEQLYDLYYTLLLKDIGCTSNAARICELFLIDDMRFKRDFLSLNNRSMPKVIGFLLSHAGKGQELPERLRALISIAKNQDTISRDLIDSRCDRGARIARQMHFSENVANGIFSLDEHWDGGGHPCNLQGKDIPLNSQITLLAQVADVFTHGDNVESALNEIRSRSGVWFDPELVKVFEKVAQREAMWSIWALPNIEEFLFELEPARATEAISEDFLDDIAHAFALIIDSKSPFTSGHSERVTLYTDLIAGKMGMNAVQRRWLKRAALLHDIGKLGVSNQVLDKPGKLTADEWDAVKMHPVYTMDVLSRVEAFSELAPIAAAHHERLDGKGYPLGLKGDEITLETRIITVADIFDALTAQRPYRAAMAPEDALIIMDTMIGTQIDPVCYASLKCALQDVDELEALAPQDAA